MLEDCTLFDSITPRCRAREVDLRRAARPTMRSDSSSWMCLQRGAEASAAKSGCGDLEPCERATAQGSTTNRLKDINGSDIWHIKVHETNKQTNTYTLQSMATSAVPVRVDDSACRVIQHRAI